MPGVLDEEKTNALDGIEVLRRRWGVVIACIVLVTGLSILFSLHEHKKYSASSQVLLSEQDLASQLSGTSQYTGITVTSQEIAQTQADMARGQQVAAQTVAAAHLTETPTEFLGSSSVTPAANANVLTFTATDKSPSEAVRLATLYAQTYVAFSGQVSTAAIRLALNEAQQTLAKTPVGSTLSKNLESKIQQLATMEALGTSNSAVISSGSPATQTAPKTIRNAVIGVLIGLLIGAGLAFGWEMLDTRVRSAEQIEELLGVPVIATLSTPRRGSYAERCLAMLYEPGGVKAEEFRLMRARLDLARLGYDIRSILVTSATAREGKTTTSTNLAIALAAAGREITLVDLDLRRPQIGQFVIGGAAAAGISEVALGQVALEHALTRIARPSDAPASSSRASASWQADGPDTDTEHIDGLRILPAGILPPNPGEFCDSPAVAAILSRLRERSDTVIVDSPPSLLVGDALVLSRHVDAILIVARIDAVTKPQLSQLRKLIAATPAKVLGVVITGTSRASRYGYGYGVGASASSRSSGASERALVPSATTVRSTAVSKR